MPPWRGVRSPVHATAQARLGKRAADRAYEPLVRFGSKQTFAPQKALSALPPKADICTATGHVRFAPNSDIDCVLRRVRFALKSGNGDLRTAVRCAEDHDNVGSPDDRAGLEPAITLSRKDWL